MQAVEREKVVEYVSTDEIGFGDSQVAFDVYPFSPFDLAQGKLIVVLLQDLPGQHQASGLAPDLASSDATPPDLSQISHGEPLFGDADETQLIADHSLDQHDDDLLQVMLNLGSLFGWVRFKLLSLGKEKIPGRQFRVEGQDDILCFKMSLSHDLLNNVLKKLVGEIIGKVEICEVVPDLPQALLPNFRQFLGERVKQPFPFLGKDRLLPHFVYKYPAGDNAPREDLLTHTLPDPAGQDRILGDLQVKGQDFWHLVGINSCKHREPTSLFAIRPRNHSLGDETSVQSVPQIR